MTTTTSSSKLSSFKKEQFGFLYRFALKKTAGWTAIYTILMFLCYPMVTITETMNMVERYAEDYFDRVNYVMNYQVVCAFLVSALMCGMVLVFSAVLYSYMHGRRSADFFHSMPVDRSVMLTANFAAGFTALVVPIILNTALASLAYPLILPELSWGPIVLSLWLDVLAWIMGAFTLLAIGTMVAVCVSTAVESVGYTVALLLEGSVLLLIWDLACESCFDTYLSIFSNSGQINNFYSELLYYLSPVFALGRVILLLSNNNLMMDLPTMGMVINNMWLPLILWTILGVGALWLAVKLYTKRHSERAQQWGRQSWLGFGVKLMSAIIGAFLFANIFGDMMDLSDNMKYTFGALTGAPLVYVITEAITNKGFTNMKKCLPYLGAAVAITVVGSLYFVVDGFGFDERIPEPEQIKTVDLELMGISQGSKFGDQYAKEWSEEAIDSGITFRDYGEESMLTLSDPETIELVTEFHEKALNREGAYITYLILSYDNGLLDTNRYLHVYHNGIDSLIKILHSDEFLENYNPFFELKGPYLEFVQITDKMDNLIGEGEIPAEAYDRLLEAIRKDLKNAEPDVLRDAKNNPNVANLSFVTKYPRDIYESTGELYHYAMNQDYTVRLSDENTCQVLKELGFDLEVQESFYDNLLSVELTEGYSYGDLPGLQKGSSSAAIFEKYNYSVGNAAFTEPADMKELIEKSTAIYSGYGDQYRLSIYRSSDTSADINGYDMYIDRADVAELMVKHNNFLVPYILTTEEWNILNKGMEVGGEEEPRHTEYAIPEEYFYWYDMQNVEDTTSMLDYCKEHHPEILEGKTDAELKCMEKTPLVNNEYGSFYRIHW